MTILIGTLLWKGIPRIYSREIQVDTAQKELLEDLIYKTDIVRNYPNLRLTQDSQTNTNQDGPGGRGSVFPSRWDFFLVYLEFLKCGLLWLNVFNCSIKIGSCCLFLAECLFICPVNPDYGNVIFWKQFQILQKVCCFFSINHYETKFTRYYLFHCEVCMSKFSIQATLLNQLFKNI